MIDEQLYGRELTHADESDTCIQRASQPRSPAAHPRRKAESGSMWECPTLLPLQPDDDASAGQPRCRLPTAAGPGNALPAAACLRPCISRPVGVPCCARCGLGRPADPSALPQQRT